MEKLMSIFTNTQNDLILFLICCVIGIAVLTYLAKFTADTKVTLNTLQVIKIVLEAKLGSKAGKILDIWIEGLNKIQDGEFSVSDGVDQFVRFIRLGAASKGVELSDEDIEKIEKFDVKLIDQDVNIRELEITDKKFILIKKDEYIY